MILRRRRDRRNVPVVMPSRSLCAWDAPLPPDYLMCQKPPIFRGKTRGTEFLHQQCLQKVVAVGCRANIDRLRGADTKPCSAALVRPLSRPFLPFGRRSLPALLRPWLGAKRLILTISTEGVEENRRPRDSGLVRRRRRSPSRRRSASSGRGFPTGSDAGWEAGTFRLTQSTRRSRRR